MTSVTFKKDHPCGIKAGKTFTFGNAHAARLEKEGYVKIDSVVDGPEDKEPPTIKHTLTKADIKNGTYPGIADDAKAGDEIDIPNPKFVGDSI